MRLGARLCLCLLLISFTVLSCSARTTMLLSDENFVLGRKGRSLSVRANDYEEPTANRGHDPPSSSRSRSGRGDQAGQATVAAEEASSS